MPIESKVKIPGFSAPLPGIFSRVVSADINTQTGSTVLTVRDWSSKEAGQKLLDKIETPLPAPDYDPANPLHIAQWEAAGKPDLAALDAHGDPWRPTIEAYSVEYRWDGEKTVEPQVQPDRKITLPLELALAVAAQSLEGAVPRKPANALEAMSAQLYLAAMASGEFVEPLAVSGLDAKAPE